jgi:hypothetical protein
MKRVIAGDGHDATAAYLAWVAGRREVGMATLYLIGNPEDPQALYLTDWESPLDWPIVGVFQPAAIKRGSVTSKIGTETDSLDITWSPQIGTFIQNIATTSPYQQAQLGWFDNIQVRIWTAYMPTPGDCNTFGCSELFGGRIGECETQRGSIVLTVNSFLDTLDEKVPTNVIELSNTKAAYTGATPPAGFTHIPQFDCHVGGSSPTTIVGDQTYPDPGSILNTNVAKDGYLVFNYGPNATLGGYWGAIAQNVKVTIGSNNYNQFVLYEALPWTPTAEDTFYISGQAPLNLSDGEYYGFPWVPNPTLGV